MQSLTDADASDLKPIGYARRWWIPRRESNRPVSPATLYRWIKRGVHGERLAVLYTPDGAVTSESACRDFLRRVDAARRAKMSPPTAIDASDAELAAAGLLGRRGDD